MLANDARKMTDTAPLVRSLALPRKSSNGATQKCGGMLNWQRATPEMSSLPHAGVPWRFDLLRLRCRGCPWCIPTRTGDSRLDARRVRFGRSTPRNRSASSISFLPDNWILHHTRNSRRLCRIQHHWQVDCQIPPPLKGPLLPIVSSVVICRQSWWELSGAEESVVALVPADQECLETGPKTES
jgi:hypothetical protein